MTPSAADVLYGERVIETAIRPTECDKGDLLTGSMELANADRNAEIAVRKRLPRARYELPGRPHRGPNEVRNQWGRPHSGPHLRGPSSSWPL